MVWQQVDASWNYKVFARRISPAGTAVGEAFPITNRPASEVSPAVAFDGTNFLAVWAAGSSNPFSGMLGTPGPVRGARITPGAAVLDPSGFDISTDLTTADPPTVTFDGTNHLVAWAHTPGPGTDSDDDPLVGRRVSPDGAIVDPVALPLGHGMRPSVGAGAGHDAPDLRVDRDDPCDAGSSGPAPLDDPPLIVTNPANGQRSPVDRVRWHRPSRRLGRSTPRR